MFAAESVVHDGVDRRASDEAGDDAAQAICQEITRAGSTIATRAGRSRRLGRTEGPGGSRRERVIGVALLSFALLVAVVATVRAGRGSMSDREREASAREHFERTGSWPGD